MHVGKIVVPALLALELSACANLTSIHYDRPFVGSRVLTVDAKQRSVFMTDRYSSQGKPDVRLCAEAAPDVFSALSASASLNANVKSQSGRAAAAIAESAGTIERTQTINLLRESMYRTCERYLSGALTRTSFVVQAARDQRTMASILAIEQLTRTVRPSSTVISGPGTSASTANGDAVSVIKQFGEERAAAIKAAADAQSEFDDAKDSKKGGIDCTTGTQPTDADQLKLWTACLAAKQTLADRQKDEASATDRLDKVLGTVSSAGSTVAETAAASGSTGSGGGAVSDSALQAVASSVERIAAGTTLDETLMFCIGLYSDVDHFPPANSPINGVCSTVISERAKLDQNIKAQQLDIREVFARPVETTDADTPLLKGYLGDATVGPAERRRRQALAMDAAVALNLIASRIDFAGRVQESDPTFAATLLARLRQLETDPGARAKLGK